MIGRAVQVAKQGIQSTFASANTAFLVDIGDSDRFVEKELRPELLEAPCAPAGIALSLRHQPGYDHSYYFISKFMPDHVAWHAERL